jgi:YD repeat-containing protein
LVSTHTDELGLVRTFTWDNLQRPTRIDYSSVSFESFSYTLDNPLPGATGPNILELTRWTDRLGYTSTFTYNGLRQRTSVKNPRNYTTSFGYCACGALETITDALSQVTTFISDNGGRLTTESYPGGATRNYRYNLLGQATDWLDHSGNVVATYIYNHQGLVAAVSNPSGQTAGVSYDAEDRPVTITVAGGPTVTLSSDLRIIGDWEKNSEKQWRVGFP